MDAKKPYVVAILIQVISTGMFVVLKATFDQGFNTFVFTFYGQAAASVLLVPIAVFRERNTFAINTLNVALRFTSATVQSATSNSKPVSTFCLALLLRMEAVNLKSPYGRRGQGTFLKIFGDMAWSLWIVFQAVLLKEFPNKMLVTVTHCVFSTAQTFIVAVVAERDIKSWKLGLDISLLAVLYTVTIINFLQLFSLTRTSKS
nr:unnamed protein product [Digitaria exilis]